MKRYITLFACLLAFAAVFAQSRQIQQSDIQNQPFAQQQNQFYAQQRQNFGQQQRQNFRQQPNHSGTFSAAEYWKRQQEFFLKAVDLTPDEAGKFFPLYNELQQKKRELNRGVRQQFRQNASEMTEEQCEKAINAMADSKIKIAELEKEYLEKFKGILPASKILKLQNAEEQFNSQILKDIQQSRGHNFQQNQQRQPQFRPGPQPGQSRPE